MYSDVDLDFKESVVTAYNDTIEGEEVETTEEVERVPTRNEEGETVQEQRAREEEEARQREEDAVTPINEEKTIRDETETFTYPGASISRVISMRIIEVKTGTIAEPIVSYRVEQYNKTAAQFINPDYVETAETQEQAEFIFDTRMAQLRADFEIEAEIDKQQVDANTPTLKSFENLNIYWEESSITLEEALVGDFDPKTFPFSYRTDGS